MSLRYFLYCWLSIGTACLCLVITGQPTTALPACLPKAPIVAQVNNPQPQMTGDRAMQSFYLQEMPTGWQKLVGIDTNDRCFDYVGRKTPYVTLTAFMTIDLATALARQRWELAGVDRQRAYIAASVRDPDVWLMPEEALAFRQIGHVIPIQSKVLPALSPYQFRGS
jgi:hypothetical protein